MGKALKEKKQPAILPYAIVSIGFLLYLAILPHFVSERIHCLSALPGISYAFAECTVTLALDTFVFFALAGAAVSILTLFFINHSGGYRLRLIGTSAVFAVAIIAAYHLYLPTAERGIKRAPILLESLRKP